MLQTSGWRSLTITGVRSLFTGLQTFYEFHSKMLPILNCGESLTILTLPTSLSNCFSLVSQLLSEIVVYLSSTPISVTNLREKITWPTVWADVISALHLLLIYVPVILIERLSALVIKGAQNRCFGSNYEDTSHFGKLFLPTVGRRSFETADNGALQLINHLWYGFASKARDWVVLS
jgi:hypothetical protein